MVRGMRLGSVQGDISSERVSVSCVYPTRDELVLKDLSLSLSASQVNALCGLSGAGEDRGLM